VVIGVTDEEPGLVEKWLKTSKAEYPIVILKDDGAFENALGVKGFPTGAVIDPSGALAFAGSAHETESPLGKAMGQAKPGSILPKKLSAIGKLLRARDLAKAYGELKKLAGLAGDEQKWAEKLTGYLEKEASAALADAKSLAEGGRVYDAVQRVSPFAKASTPFPTTADSAAFLKGLEADAAFKKEMAGGPDFAKAKALEDEGEYSEAVRSYSALSKKLASTKIGAAAKARAEELVNEGMPGFKGVCETCRKGKRACEKHKEEIKV
jgi:hypothetical protein